MRYAGHFMISLFVISKGGFHPTRFGSPQMGWVVLRGSFLLAGTVMNFVALKYIPLTLTSTLMFSAPLMVCALSGPLLGERVGIWRWMAVMVGFAGVLVAIRPFDATFHWAMLLSIVTAASFSLYIVLTRKLSGLVPTDTLQLYAGGVGTLILLPFAIATWQQPASTAEWVFILAIGGLGWLGHELMTRAHGFADASRLTPYSYILIAYMTFWGYQVFGQTPDFWTLVGAAIIISSGLVIWVRERRLAMVV